MEQVFCHPESHLPKVKSINGTRESCLWHPPWLGDKLTFAVGASTGEAVGPTLGQC